MRSTKRGGSVEVTQERPNVLVTGGAGFLGQALLRELQCEGAVLLPGLIRVFDLRQRNPFRNEEIEYVVGDVRDTESLTRATRDIDIVFHLAGLVDWGTHSPEVVMDINYGGTKNVIEACRASGSRVLVCTSSLDAIGSKEPIHDADEQRPYPKIFPNAYCESKAEAEKTAKAAASETLKVTVIRPAGIYGEADPYHLGGLIDLARTGFYLRVGDGTARCMHAYVGNVAHGHILAASKLWQGQEEVNGQIFFIGDHKAENFFKFLDPMVEAAGYKLRPKDLWIPRGVMYPIGALLETLALILRPIYRWNPKLSRFAVDYICTDFTFVYDKAAQLLNYTPKYNDREAMERTVDYFKSRSRS